MRDSSNIGGGEQSSPLPAPPVRRPPFKRFTSLSTLNEDAQSPALLQTLSIVGRLGREFSVGMACNRQGGLLQ